MTPATSYSVNCIACAGRPSYCRSSTCMRPPARTFRSRRSMSAKCCRSRSPTARRARPGHMSTTGRSRTCRASPRDGFWRSRGFTRHSGAREARTRNLEIPGSCCACPEMTASSSGPLFRLGLLLHVGAQHGVDAALIAVALALEIVEHILVDANGDGLLPAGNDQNCVRPIDIYGRRIRIICDRLGDLLVRELVDACPVSLALPAIAPFSRYDILFLHFSSRGALR